MPGKFSGMAQVATLTAVLFAGVPPAQAMDLSPDLFIEGSCDDVIVWAAQPVDVLIADFRTRFGDGMANVMKSSSGPTILKMSKSMPVENNWFENNCTFTDEQLDGMGNVHTAYIAYLEEMAGG